MSILTITVASLSTLLGNLLCQDLDGLWRHLERICFAIVGARQAALVQKLVKNN
jgi:hypothetical protein